jgi:hypothetical protein
MRLPSCDCHPAIETGERSLQAFPDPNHRLIA